jgi:hypothetical protein
VWLNPQVLAVPGTYSVVWAPNSTAGSVAATLYNVPADPTATIPVDGSNIKSSITVPGQKGVWTFAGTSGQKVSLRLDFWQMYYCSTYEVKNPDGTWLVPSTYSCQSNVFAPTTAVALPQTGTYTVSVTPELGSNPAPAGRGTYGATAFPVPADATSSITLGGSRAKVGIGTPGQNASFTFAGTASQKVVAQLDLNAVTTCVDFSVLLQNGTPLVTQQNACGGVFLISNSVINLAATAQTYTITLKPVLNGKYNDGTGAAFGVVLNVPANPSAVPITVDGAAAFISIPNTGQRGTYSFTTSAANKKVNGTIDLSAMTTCNTISVLNGATTVFGPTDTCASSFSTGTVTLPTAGANSIVVTPILNLGNQKGFVTAGTGSVAATLVTVP